MPAAHTPVLIRNLLIGAFDKYADQPAVTFAGETWSYADVASGANRLAQALIADGIAPGERVAVMTSNCPEFAVAGQGIYRAGAAQIPTNDVLSDEERLHILRDSNAKIAIATRSQVGPALQVLREDGELRRVILVDDDGELPDGAERWSDVLAAYDDVLPEVEVHEDTIALIPYTGGTTGLPKGVLHTQRTVATALISHAIEMELASDDAILATSPLPHAVGFLMLAGFLKGNRTFIEPGFDIDDILDRIENDGASVTFMVPTMIYRLLDRIKTEPRDLTNLRTVIYGAAPITSERLSQGMELLGPVFVQLYGQTECPNWITRLTRDHHKATADHPELLGSCGQPCAMTEVRIVDADDNELPRGEVGEITARSPYQTVGYHNRDEATAKTLRGGWLHTGDVGYQDERGFVYLVDRKNDMIISGGMNVYSTAVENAVAAQPGVSQVAVVGVEHADWGEAVVAYVVPEPGQQVDERTVIDGVRRSLARYEVPKRVVSTDELPVTSVGKIDKKRLRAAWPGWDD